MTHGGVQFNDLQFGTRVGRNADSRVAVPLGLSPPRTRFDPTVGSFGTFSNTMANAEPIASPTIVQSSSEQQTTSQDGNRNDQLALLKSAESKPFTNEVPLTDIDRHGTHYIRLQGQMTDHDNLIQIKNTKHAHKASKFCRCELSDTWALCLVFDDARDATNFKEHLRARNTKWNVEGISHGQYAKAKDFLNDIPSDNTTEYDGQIILQAKFTGAQVDVIDIDNVGDEFRRIAVDHGDVRVMRNVSLSQEPYWQFRVEYFATSHAQNAIASVTRANPRIYNGWEFVAYPIVPSQAGGTPTTRHAGGGAIELQRSPTGRTAWTVDQDGTSIPQQPSNVLPKYEAALYDIEYDFSRMQFGQGPEMRARQNSLPNSEAHGGLNMSRSHTFSSLQNMTSSTAMTPFKGNRRRYKLPEDPTHKIHPENIAAGKDIRTTIMIRNLPNRWSAKNIKNILDGTIHGCYDFSYLRIDFSQNTNVGYAFVNAINSDTVQKFYERWHGQEWQPGKWPHKVCEVSYATIQGLDNLIEKFRNSSIMDEYVEFRPKLFYTNLTKIHPHEAGDERPFPAANNLTKKQRSQDNAGQIGLYAPRTGPRGDRARRSQYDRGTTAQMLEDGVYNNGNGSNYSIYSPNVNHFPNGFNNGMPMPQHVGYAFPPVGVPNFYTTGYGGGYTMPNAAPNAVPANYPRSANMSVPPGLFTPNHNHGYNYPTQGTDTGNNGTHEQNYNLNGGHGYHRY